MGPKVKEGHVYGHGVFVARLLNRFVGCFGWYVWLGTKEYGGEEGLWKMWRYGMDFEAGYGMNRFWGKMEFFVALR